MAFTGVGESSVCVLNTQLAPDFETSYAQQISHNLKAPLLSVFPDIRNTGERSPDWKSFGVATIKITLASFGNYGMS